MTTIKISMSGTLETIKYCLLALWQGWCIKSIKRTPRPTEYTVEMKPPNKAHPKAGDE